MLIFGSRSGVRKLLLASVAFEDLPKYCLANKQKQQWKMRNTKSGDTTRRAFCRWYLSISTYISLVSVAYATIDFRLIQFDNLLQTGEGVWPQGEHIN